MKIALCVLLYAVSFVSAQPATCGDVDTWAFDSPQSQCEQATPLNGDCCACFPDNDNCEGCEPTECNRMETPCPTPRPTPRPTRRPTPNPTPRWRNNPTPRPTWPTPRPTWRRPTPRPVGNNWQSSSSSSSKKKKWKSSSSKKKWKSSSSKKKWKSSSSGKWKSSGKKKKSSGKKKWKSSSSSSSGKKKKWSAQQSAQLFAPQEPMNDFNQEFPAQYTNVVGGDDGMLNFTTLLQVLAVLLLINFVCLTVRCIQNAKKKTGYEAVAVVSDTEYTDRE